MRWYVINIYFMFLSSILISQRSIDLTEYLPVEHVKNATVDYTKYLQKGINENLNLILPNFPVLINPDGLILRNNQILTFQNASVLKMKANDKEKYGLLNFINVENVTIRNAVLVGDRDNHFGNKGEWGMGLNILSSKNIKIINPKISKFWGDGIYIGEIDYKNRNDYHLDDYFCHNIVICDGILDNNRRNGISIISVKNLVLDNMSIINTTGTMPMAAIDIEPNNNSQFIEGIRILNTVTRNNNGPALKYVPSNFYGKRKKNISIYLENFEDFGSKTGIFIGGARSSYKKDFSKLDGYILFKNFKTHSTENFIKTGSIQILNPKITIENFEIFENGQRSFSMEEKIKLQLKATKKIKQE